MPDFSSPSKARGAKVMVDLKSPSKPKSSKAIAEYLSPPRPPRPPKFASHKSAESDSGVRVIVRVRPLSEKEQQEDAVSTISTIADNLIAVADHQYAFDAVATASSSQEDMFRLVGVPVIENCIAGFNSSIFAYGQTGSGKTYTMWGTRSYPGLAPRVLENLLVRVREEETKNAGKNLFYRCRCSFLEIFNEQIADLFDPRHRNLQIREDVKRGVYVDNLSEEYLSDAADVSRMLDKGLANRRIGATSMNTESSRSHTVFTCVLECRFRSAADGMSSMRRSRINLVDLAGSERQGQSGAAGDRLREAGNINRSLSQLGNVINILAEVAQTGRQRHVPYRDSRLTFLLQESLGGNAKLAMICAVSPADSCKSETTSTLRFAQRAKSIQNKAVINEETTNDSNILREQIRELKDELKRMKAQAKQPAGSEGWNPRRSYSLLRSSLALPMTLPRTAESDTDEDMEVEEREADISIHQDDMAGDTDVCQEAWQMREIAELRRALELAMAGQAKLLEQYADLQEKYVSLVDKQRKIREGMMDARKMGVKVGLTTTQLRWMESLSAQIVALNLEREQERQAANEEIELLQAQLRETRAAAGEILVQLKESEAAQVEPLAAAAPVLGTDADTNSLVAASGKVPVELKKDEPSVVAGEAALQEAGPPEPLAAAPASENAAFSDVPVAGPTRSVWVNEDEEMCNYYASL